MGLPVASLRLPWDDAAAPDPVDALRAARAEVGDRFWVHSGATQYLFVFDEPALEWFYALAERDASKGLADYRMLVRKLPDELFADRRTFAHDLFGAHDVESYLDDLDTAIEAQLASMGARGSFDVFEWSRTIGHRLALACWCGRDVAFDALVPDMEVLDGAEAFVRPAAVAASHDGVKAAERAALRRVEATIAARLADPTRPPSFLDVIDARWVDVADAGTRAAGVAGDVVLLHVATMTNLFAALGWTLALVLLHDDGDGDRDDPAPIEWCATEAIRVGQRSIMFREVLRPLELDGEPLARGQQIATMLPLTNDSVGGYEPQRWSNRALRHDVGITTFGHGSHRCPAARFSMSAIVRTVTRLRDAYELRPRFTDVTPLRGQIGGMARAAEPCPVDYQRRSTDATVAPEASERQPFSAGGAC